MEGKTSGSGARKRGGSGNEGAVKAQDASKVAGRGATGTVRGEGQGVQDRGKFAHMTQAGIDDRSRHLNKQNDGYHWARGLEGRPAVGSGASKKR